MNGLASFSREVIARSSLLGWLTSGLFELTTATTVASNTLSPSAEEALHAAETVGILLPRRLCLALDSTLTVIELLVSSTSAALVLETATIVAKACLAVTLGTV